jgi:putative addiction module antidote
MSATATPATTVLKLTQIGNSVGVILPKEVLAELNVEKGDTLNLVKHPDGYVLTAYDAEFSRQMEAGRHIMKKHRDVLRMLSKS